MNKIIWHRDGNIINRYAGYLNKARVCHIHHYEHKGTTVLYFMDRDPVVYHRLDNAKVGAERMLKNWLRDAGLKVAR